MIKEKINWGLQATVVCAVYCFSVYSAPTAPYPTACGNASEYCWLLEFSNKKREGHCLIICKRSYTTPPSYMCTYIINCQFSSWWWDPHLCKEVWQKRACTSQWRDTTPKDSEFLGTRLINALEKQAWLWNVHLCHFAELFVVFLGYRNTLLEIQNGDVLGCSCWIYFLSFL